MKVTIKHNDRTSTLCNLPEIEAFMLAGEDNLDVYMRVSELPRGSIDYANCLPEDVKITVVNLSSLLYQDLYYKTQVIPVDIRAMTVEKR